MNINANMVLLAVFMVFAQKTISGPLDELSKSQQKNITINTATEIAAKSCLALIKSKIKDSDITIYGPCPKNNGAYSETEVKNNKIYTTFNIEESKKNQKGITIICEADLNGKIINYTDKYKTILDRLTWRNEYGAGGDCIGHVGKLDF